MYSIQYALYAGVYSVRIYNTIDSVPLENPSTLVICVCMYVHTDIYVKTYTHICIFISLFTKVEV